VNAAIANWIAQFRSKAENLNSLEIFMLSSFKHLLVTVWPTGCFTMTPMDTEPAVGASSERSCSRKKRSLSSVHFPSSDRCSRRVVSDSKWATRLGFRLVVVTLAISMGGACNRQTQISRHLDFNQDVQPILASRCFSCHGPDPEMRKAGLRLDLAEWAMKTREGHRDAIVPGHPEKSELVKRIESSVRRDLERVHLAYELVLGRPPAPDESRRQTMPLRRRCFQAPRGHPDPSGRS